MPISYFDEATVNTGRIFFGLTKNLLSISYKKIISNVHNLCDEMLRLRCGFSNY